MLKHLGSAPPKVVHDTVRLLLRQRSRTSSTTTSRATSSRATSPPRASSEPRSARCRRGRAGARCSWRWASTTARLGAWSFHKGGNGGFTQVLARAAQAYGAEIRAGGPGRPRAHLGRPGDGRRARGRHRVPAPVVTSALDPRRTFTELVDPRSCPATWSRASAASASRAPPRRSTSPSTARRSIPRWPTAPTSTTGSSTSGRRSSTSSGPSTRRSTAGTPSAPTSTAASSPSSTPTWRRPASTSCRASSSTPPTTCKGSDWDDERENLGDTVQATLESFFPGFGDLVAAPRGRDAARHRAGGGAERGQHLRR